MANTALKENLRDFIQILKAEKEALIKNDGKKVEELLSMKEDFAKEIEIASQQDIDREDEQLIRLIKEIKEQQETNLMLTEQAMSYIQKFISAFQKEVQKDITYSKQTKKPGNGKASILNQSL